MTKDLSMLDQALDEAHLPSLLVALTHITGNTAHLRDDLRPFYDFFSDSRTGGLSEDKQVELKAFAKKVITDYFTKSEKLLPQPSSADMRKMMDFLVAAPIPEHYVPFLMEELALEGRDMKHPHWDTPALKAASRKMHVVIVGAGMSGILSAIRLQQAGISFEIIEKNADVGGTWYENSYPGCRVDTQNHLYSYSFEPNHNWPMHYSTQAVLLNYFKTTADKYALRKHIRFETHVVECVFDEDIAMWNVRVRGKEGKEQILRANAVISAVGQLNQPRFPDIKGRETFKGPSFHSAHWRHDIDLKGKRVAVIGTGASAFQFVPAIAPTVGELLVFQRTPPWLAPTPDYHYNVGAGKNWLLEHLPFYDKWYRFFLFWIMTDGIYEAVKADPAWDGPPNAVSPANAMVREMLIAKIAEQTGDPLLSNVVPAYPIGGKRMLRDNGVWIDALKRDNVKLVTTNIEEIAPDGVVTSDGIKHKVDVLIYGTGFYASHFLRTMKVVGRDHVELHDKWAGDARAYLGMMVPGFPNFFCIYGPNTNIVVNGSIVFFSECSVRYILSSLKLLAETGHATMEVKSQVHDAYNEKVDEANKLMAWGVPQVSSWYKNDKGRVSQNWPFPLVDYWKATLQPNPDDFIFGEKQSKAAA